MMQKALEIKKDDATVLLSIAGAYLENRQIKEAKITVDKVLAEEKGHLDANLFKGRFYLLRKDYANALDRFDFVLNERPNDAEAHYLKGLSLAGKKELILARQEFLKTIELNPNKLEARLILARYYLRDGQNELAKTQIERALNQAPQDIKVLI